MKVLYVTLLLAVIFLISDTSAERVKKHRRLRRPHKKTTTEDPELIRNEINTQEKKVDADEDLEAKNAKQEAKDQPSEGDSEIIDNRLPMMDPCIKVRCGAGRICELDANNEPQCVCIPTCPEESDSRKKVCSNHNETWSSDCAVYQQRCLCDTNGENCRGPEYKHVHIEYYGECRQMPDCSTEEMEDFPRRMRDWLFNIMRDLADREELTPHYLKMEREAESNMTRRWTNAAIWKFCDLDGNPPDRSVSRHELFPIRAPLMSLEHCIAPFLNSCDADNNHRITLKEWAKCLELDEDEIEDRCEEISEDDADTF